MKLISWNVNVRAVEKGFLDWLSQEDPDILCIQETKADRTIRSLLTEEHGYYTYLFR